MKKIFGIAALAALIGLAAPAYSQDSTAKKESRVKKVEHGVKKGAKGAWNGTKKGVKAASDETAELATKGKAKLTDKKSDEWQGPAGQTIYVDDGSKYYWVNEKGGREFVTKDQLKPKQN